MYVGKCLKITEKEYGRKSEKYCKYLFDLGCFYTQSCQWENAAKCFKDCDVIASFLHFTENIKVALQNPLVQSLLTLPFK